MSGPEFTFTTHPRPASDDPRLIVDAVPATVSAGIEKAAAPIKQRRERDSILGELALLVRYAFGRF